MRLIRGSAQILQDWVSIILLIEGEQVKGQFSRYVESIANNFKEVDVKMTNDTTLK
jgi:hypothetical protein